MKYLFKTFDKYLPRCNYNNEPILFLNSNDEIIYIYSFDRKKEVVLTSDMCKQHFRYMSLFEIYYDDWNIIKKDEIERILLPNFNYDDLPF